MTQRALCFLVILVSGCTASRVQRDTMATVKKLGVLSVTLDRIGMQDTDRQVLEQVAASTVARYTEQLAGAGRWEVVPQETLRANPAFLEFAQPTRSSVYREVLAKTAQDGAGPADPSLVMRTLGAKMRGNAEELRQLEAENTNALAAQLEAMMALKRQNFVGAPDLPFLPYDMLRPASGGTQVRYSAGNAARKPPEERMREAMVAAVARLAGTLGVDALAIAYHRIGLAAGRGRVFVNDRGIDTIHMAPTLLIITRDGRVAVDTGYPTLDSLSHSRFAVPVYKKVGERDREVDLAGAGGQVAPVIQEMSLEVSRALVADVVKELTKG
ncbi:MAG: hypothetical protein ACKVPX_15625 [Myxococcaceae bacterium]